MNILIRHIEYLMSRNGSVIIPGVGAVLAKFEPAVFDASANIVVPPHREFTFNSSMRHNDGSLAWSVARAEAISYDEANAKVEKMTEAFNRQLHIAGEISIGRIGKLFLDSESEAPEFMPYAVDVLSPNTSWLPKVERIASVRQSEDEGRNELPARRTSRFARFARIAASIALLLCICFIASTPISVQDAALASLTPEIKPVPAEDFLPSTLDDADTCSQVLKIVGSKEPIAETIIEPERNYLIIVGSFSTESEAEKYIDQNHKDNWKILEKNGRFRVYSAAFETEAEAYAAIAKDSVISSNAWVCKR